MVKSMGAMLYGLYPVKLMPTKERAKNKSFQVSQCKTGLNLISFNQQTLV